MSEHSVTDSPYDDTCVALESDDCAVERVRNALPGDALLRKTSALFAAMGDPTRLRLLEALALEELCVCDLASLTGVSQSAVSHQLRHLRTLGLVAFRRVANRAVYRLADDHVRALLAQGFEHAAEECAP